MYIDLFFSSVGILNSVTFNNSDNFNNAEKPFTEIVFSEATPKWQVSVVINKRGFFLLGLLGYRKGKIHKFLPVRHNLIVKEISS